MATKSPVQTLLRQFKSYGDTFLYTPENLLYCFPKETVNDLVIQIRSFLIVKQPVYFDRYGDTPKRISKKDVQNLYENLQKLEVVYDEEFNLHRTQISAIQDLIKDKNTPYTHIRFFSENNQVKVRIFDYTSFVSELYVKDKPVTIYEEIIEDTFIKNDFNFSINVSSFKEMQKDEYTVQTFGDEYIKFSGMSDVSYYFRNQNIQEPIVRLSNVQHPKDIVFYFQPSSIVASDHTNQ